MSLGTQVTVPFCPSLLSVWPLREGIGLIDGGGRDHIEWVKRDGA